MSNWYGKDCKHQICQFEGWYTEYGYEQDKSSPVLVFCNHKNNKHDHEGNCCEKWCPTKD